MEVTQSPVVDVSADDEAEIIDHSHFLDTPIALECDQLDESTPTNNAAIKEQSSKNGLLIEFQNTISAMCYESVNLQTMKIDELCVKVHERLFSTSTRKGFAEQLMNAEGIFQHLFERVPVESHGLHNATTCATYKHQIEPFLLGMDNKAWCIEDVFTSEILCNSSIGSTSKTTPRNFMCNG